MFGKVSTGESSQSTLMQFPTKGLRVCICVCVRVFSSPPAVHKQAVGVCTRSPGWWTSFRTALPCASPPPVSAHSSSESSTGSPHKIPEYLAKR